MNEPVLLADYNGIPGRHEARSERRRTFLIEPSLHVFHEVFPSIVSEIRAGLGEARAIALPKIQRTYGRLLGKS
jgi:hypothetical protein